MICLLRVGFDDAEEADEKLFAPVTDRLGNYRIQRRDDGTAWELGHGAMGVTYRAVDTSLQRPVALKLIASEWVKRGAEARERFMKRQLNSTIKAHLLPSALFLLPLMAVCVVPFALGQRQTDALSLHTDPTGLICNPGSWEAGADLPSPAVRMVGVFFPANARFYGMGGRSSEVAGSDFVHPFEYDAFANTWTPKAATYPDNEVNNMNAGTGELTVQVFVSGS